MPRCREGCLDHTGELKLARTKHQEYLCPVTLTKERLSRGGGILSVAPMMDWTDRHERAFLRTISRRTLLYTEMVTTGAILHGDRDRLLAFGDSEHPVAKSTSTLVARATVCSEDASAPA